MKSNAGKNKPLRGAPAAVLNLQNYLISRVKSAVAPLSFTSTSFSTPSGDALRCSATILYLPGGTFLMVNLPSLSVTAKYGLSTTVTQANIQGCTSHWNFMKFSGAEKL